MAEGNGIKLKKDRDPKNLVYERVEEFFTYYFGERDIEKTLSMVSDQVFSVGTGEGEMAAGKERFCQLLQEEVKLLPDPIDFMIDDYTERARGTGCWDCLLSMTVIVTVPEGAQAQYHMRITMGLHQEGDRYIFDMLHASEASVHQENGEFFPLKLVSRWQNTVNEKTKADILELVGQIMPGGIVGGYDEEGYPLYMANERFLEMAGYESYGEFEEDIQGRIIHSIHPEDREFVCSALEHSFRYRDQYEIQYRMKKKDGTYIWVQDIGKKTSDSKGRPAIISVIIDISEQMERQKTMEREMAIDSLTGLYNRKKGEERIRRALKRKSQYIFFMLDIDNFKRVNDIYGHDQGDKVLQEFGKQVGNLFRREDTVCRMGGDEFVIFVYDTSDVNAIAKKVESLSRQYCDMMNERWPEAHSTLSIGGVVSDTYYDFMELYKKADTLLYKVKKTRKGGMMLLESEDIKDTE